MGNKRTCGLDNNVASLCSFCRFSYVGPGFGQGLLECRRYPPTIIADDEVDYFPAVRNDYWCGEWQAKQCSKE